MQYIRHDVLIVAKALKVLFDEKLTNMTQGSNALHDYVNIISKKKFEHFFPSLDMHVDSEIRQAYKGGFTYLNPIYKEKDVGKGVVLDVNSLYPSCMRYCSLPYGEPVFFTGKYKKDKTYTLYVQSLTCRFELKKNKIPTIQVKHNPYFIGNEYLTSSKNAEGGFVTLVLTNIDLDLFFEHYNVYDITYNGGWAFREINGLFDKYIDKWIERKNKATIEKNKRSTNTCKINVKFPLRQICDFS